jgi:hypothetical protein
LPKAFDQGARVAGTCAFIMAANGIAEYLESGGNFERATVQPWRDHCPAELVAPVIENDGNF